MLENPEDPAFWDEPTKLIFYTCGALHLIQQMGLIDGGKLKLTEQGAQSFQRLHASGYRPTKEAVFALLVQPGHQLSCAPDHADGAAELVMRLDEIIASRKTPS